MEGEQMAKCLQIYKEKYRDVLARKKFNGIQKNGTLSPNNHHAITTESNANNRKRSSELIRRLAPIKVTDGKVVDLHLLNDYTSEKLKAELAEYEKSKTVKAIIVCPACQGGKEDNPKIVSESIGNVVEKWEFLFRLLLAKLEASQLGNEDETNVGESAADPLGALNRCNSFDDLTPSLTEINEEKLDLANLSGTLGEGTEKLVAHCQSMSRILLGHSADVDSATKIISGLILAQRRLSHYAKALSAWNSTAFEGETAGNFAKARQDLSEVIDAVMNQILQYHLELAQTVVIHDGAESQDWSNPKPFYEGERISPAIQFWGFHLQGLRADLYTILPPTMATNILGKVFDETLGSLTVRYCQVRPSARRLSQYRADLTSILLLSHDLLLSLVPNLGSFFGPTNKTALISRSVHAKCTILVNALTIIGCPIKVLARSFDRCGYSPKAPATLAVPGTSKNSADSMKLRPMEKGNDNSSKLIQWLHLLLSGLYPDPLVNSPASRLPTPSLISLLARQCALSAGGPELWPAVTRLCLTRGGEFARLVMAHFGAFVPGLSGGETTLVKSMREGCGGLLCAKRCLATADIFWPQVVGSGVLYVAMHGSTEVNCLVRVIEPLLKRLSPSSWDVLNVSVMWNVKKPVWFQALLDLLEPYFLPILDDLLEDLESGRTWTLAHVPEAMRNLSQNLVDVSQLIPVSFYQVCKLIESLLPEDVSPVCGSVVTHIFVSCVYGLINKLVPVFREWRMQRENVDFLVALGEKLCHLDDNESEMPKFNSLTKEVSEDEENANGHAWDATDAPEEFIDTLATMVSEQLLVDHLGQEALTAVHRFICYNSEWVQRSLGVSFTAGGVGGGNSPNSGDGVSIAGSDYADGDKPRLVPWAKDVFKRPDPREMANVIGGINFASTLDYPHTWDENVRFVASESVANGGNVHLLLRLLERRPEAKSAKTQLVNDGTVEESDRVLMEGLAAAIDTRLVEQLIIDR